MKTHLCDLLKACVIAFLIVGLLVTAFVAVDRAQTEYWRAVYAGERPGPGAE